LQASEFRYRLATRATNDVIWEWDVRTNELAWAENVLFVFGYPPEEIGSDSSWRDDHIHPADRPRVISTRDEAIKSSELIWADEYRFLLKNGSYATISDQGYIERDSGGQAIRLIGAMSDITSRKQAEERIRHQLQQLKALRAIDIAISSTFDMKASLAVLLDKVTSQLKVSAAAILLLNRPTHMLEYFAGNGFIFTTIEQTRLKSGEGLAGRAALERRPVRANLIQDGDARTRLLVDEGFVGYYAVPLIAKEELKGVLEIFHRDELQADSQWLEFLEALTGQAAIAIDNAQLFENLQRSKIDLERRVAERTAELHRMNLELEDANRAKNEFLANMSHELRTPLNSIIGLSESLLEQGHDSLSEKQQRSLQVVASSGQHLLELITDILDLSKIEAGKFEFQPQLVPVDDLCRSSLAFVNSQAVKKSITVTYQNEASVASLSGDPRRLKQILINLLSNAVKFTPENGRVSLQVSTNPEQDRIQFSITDTGIGIAPEDLGRLFQPFVQLDSALHRQYEGTGLGLSLVQKLADLHGGSVEVDSAIGQGSRFTIYLPLGSEITAPGEGAESEVELSGDRQTEKDTEAPGAPPTRATILLAEDNAANILTIGEYLESHSYEIIVARDGIEAIEKAEKFNPDIILMDIQMPAMNGMEAIARLQANSRFESTPIIALTALAMPGDRERCLKAGATEYMSKPVSLRSLANTIAKLLQQTRQLHHEEH
jgi:PAS domain S-box-containing protein